MFSIRKIFFLYMAVFIAASLCAVECVEDPFLGDPLFNTTILGDSDQVEALLQAEGFEQGTFRTSDNFNIAYSYLRRQGARYNVIVCAGYHPGRKEGVASLYRLLPSDCNILFFDARGRGKSGGSCLLHKTLKVGINEYRDLIAAFDFLRVDNTLPNIIFGLCFGAYNAVRAVTMLQHEGRLEAYDIRGLVFDSGLPALRCGDRHILPEHIIQKVIRVRVARAIGCLKNDIQVEQSLLFRLPSSMIHGLFWGVAQVHGVWRSMRPYLWRHHNVIMDGIRSDDIAALPFPILFIHSYDDRLMPIEPVKELARYAQRPMTWWIEEPSYHAEHHLKHKYAYRDWLAAFCQVAVPLFS